MVLQHRSGRLLDLQEQRILFIAALEQNDERARTDAADAHDLARHVNKREAFEQPAPIILKRCPIGAELVVDRALHLGDREATDRADVPQWHDDRWLADDPVPAVDLLGELAQCLEAVAGVRLLRGLLDPLLVASCRSSSACGSHV